jgi:hypothetical protein
MAEAVTPSRTVVLLAAAIAALALVAAGAGLAWTGGEGRSEFRTVRSETVELYGEGLYRHDTIFKAGANRGADVVTLALGLPLLLLALRWYRRGSVRGALLLAGALAWFLYVYASLAFGTAYNELFLVYVALFSASLAAFVLTFLSLDVPAAVRRFSERLPRRRVAAFMLAAGGATAAAWLVPLGASLLRGQPPGLLESYATMVTETLDLGVIVPACFLAGALLLRENGVGYLVAFPLLVLVAFLAPMMAAQTYMQLAAGVTLTTGEIVGIIGGFGVISLLGAWVAAVIFRGVHAPEPPIGQLPQAVSLRASSRG